MICIQICSNREWRSFKEIFSISAASIGVTPYGEYVSKIIEGKECIFYHSGATKTKSTGACQYAISKWNPNFIFVLGTCGGVSSKLNVLDVVIANKTVQYDCIVGDKHNTITFYEKLIEEIDNSWIDFTKLTVSIFEGLIATADQDLGPKQLDMLASENVLCADWESGAISHICRLNNVKCCILRGISDIPRRDDDQSHDKQTMDYRTNTPLIMKKLLNDVLPSLLTQLN